MPSHVHADGVVHDHPMSSHHVDLPGLPSHVDIFDTILRDGSQQEGLSLTVEDKIRVAEQLDNLGVHRGWLARSQPQGHRIFQALPRRAHLNDGDLGGLWLDETRRRQG